MLIRDRNWRFYEAEGGAGGGASDDAAVSEEQKPAADAAETPAAATPDPQADIKRALAAAERIAAESKQEREAYLRTIQNLTTAGLSERREAQPEQEPELPEVDESVAKYVEHKVEKRLKETLGGIEKVYQTDRQNDLTYRATIEEDRAIARHKLDSPEAPVTREEFKSYLSQLPIEYRGNPAVVDEAYFTVRGRKADEADRIAAGRAASVATTARSAGSSDAPRYTSEERAFIQQRVNPSFTDDDAKVFGRGPTSIEDYKKSRKIS